MRYFIALAIAALITSGAFYVTPSFASDDEQSQEEQSIQEEGQQEDTQMIEQGSDEQMQSDESEQGK